MYLLISATLEMKLTTTFIYRANGTFDASSERKRKFDPSLQGRKADFSVYVSSGYHRQPLLVSEVKPPRNSRSSRRDDLLKLGNEMKDAIDKIIHDGVEEDVAVCGLLVEGNNILNNYGCFNG